MVTELAGSEGNPRNLRGKRHQFGNLVPGNGDVLGSLLGEDHFVIIVVDTDSSTGSERAHGNGNIDRGLAISGRSEHVEEVGIAVTGSLLLTVLIRIGIGTFTAAFPVDRTVLDIHGEVALQHVAVVGKQFEISRIGRQVRQVELEDTGRRREMEDTLVVHIAHERNVGHRVVAVHIELIFGIVDGRRAREIDIEVILVPGEPAVLGRINGERGQLETILDLTDKVDGGAA